MRKLSYFTIVFGLLITMFSCKTEEKNNQQTSEQVVVENMMTRRSVRAYKPEPVPREIMDVILECGVYAPNGMNKQPWEIRVVSDAAYLEGVTKLQIESMDPDDKHHPSKDPKFRNMFRNAPTVVFIAYKPGLCSQVDCGLLAGNMVNTAWAYGIGSCIQMGPINFMKTEQAAPYLEKLGFSEEYELLMAIGFGYPDETPAVKARDMEKIKFVE